MKNKKKILSKYRRKVTVNEREWTYRITRKTIHICNPERTEKMEILYQSMGRLL